MPRMKGFLQIAGRCERTVGYISISTSPAVLRTAMAVCTLPRIITPSKSACPPMLVYLLFAINILSRAGAQAFFPSYIIHHCRRMSNAGVGHKCVFCVSSACKP